MRQVYDYHLNHANKILRANLFNLIELDHKGAFQNSYIVNVAIRLRDWNIGEGDPVFLSADCDSYDKLNFQLKQLERDIAKIRAETKLMFSTNRKAEL